MNSEMDEDGPKPESADYWHKRADEARSVADWLLDEITKGLMLEIADNYERIAKAYEEHEVRIEQPRAFKQR